MLPHSLAFGSEHEAARTTHITRVIEEEDLETREEGIESQNSSRSAADVCWRAGASCHYINNGCRRESDFPFCAPTHAHSSCLRLLPSTLALSPSLAADRQQPLSPSTVHLINCRQETVGAKVVGEARIKSTRGDADAHECRRGKHKEG